LHYYSEGTKKREAFVKASSKPSRVLQTLFSNSISVQPKSPPRGATPLIPTFKPLKKV
jgi:hypothetical protein